MDRRGFFVFGRIQGQALTVVKLLTGRQRHLRSQLGISRHSGNTELLLNCRRFCTEPFVVSPARRLAGPGDID
jgi:hypothetical protein